MTKVPDHRYKMYMILYVSNTYKFKRYKIIYP